MVISSPNCIWHSNSLDETTDPQTPTTTEAAGALIVYDITNRSSSPAGMEGMRKISGARKRVVVSPMGAFTGNTWVKD